MCWLPIQNCANVSGVTVGTQCNPEQGLGTSLELSPEQNNVICASHWADLSPSRGPAVPDHHHQDSQASPLAIPKSVTANSSILQSPKGVSYMQLQPLPPGKPFFYLGCT